jgi:methyltransferase OMS1
MSSQTLRRLAIFSSGTAAYGTAVYLFYSFYANTPQNHNDSSLLSTATSYISAPNRTDTFNHIAQCYDAEISREESVMGLTLLRRALLYFHSNPGSLLEVGAGTGRNLGYYPKHVSKIVLTDFSEKMLLQARSKLKNDPDSRVQLFVADAANMTRYYPPNTFDTVLDTFGLCSFDDPVQVLKELQRVCKPDGKILLLEHGTSKTWKGLANFLDKNAERHAKNWGCVWNRDLDAILDDAGLEIDQKDTWHFGTTYYVVARPNAKSNADEERSVSTNVFTNDISDASKKWKIFKWIRKSMFQWKDDSEND